MAASSLLKDVKDGILDMLNTKVNGRLGNEVIQIRQKVANISSYVEVRSMCLAAEIAEHGR